MRLEELPDPTIIEPTDAIIRIYKRRQS